MSTVSESIDRIIAVMKRLGLDYPTRGSPQTIALAKIAFGFEDLEKRLSPVIFVGGEFQEDDK